MAGRCLSSVCLALFALAMALALHANVEPASAQSGEMVTTELQPGLNLAGWTEGEAPVESIFDAIPALEAVHAWDGEHQRFRLAVRTHAGLLGGLDTLTPGMGLWLRLGGDASVTWTRPLVPQAGPVFLHEGWNLVVWAGGVPVADAFELLGDSLEEAVDEDGRPYLVLTRGDAFWVRVSAATQWDRGDAPSRVAGVVVGPDGSPQAGLRISAEGERHWEARAGQTDDQGRFEFWVERETYTLSISTGHCSLAWSTADSRVEFPARGLPGLAVDGDVAGLVIELAATPSEHCASLKGVVLSPDGVPLRDITVRIHNLPDWRTDATVTGDDGGFEWTLGSGRYSLSLAAGDCALSFAGQGTPTSMIIPDRLDIELARGVVAGIVVVPSDRLSGACRWIRGVVTDLAGNPRAGASIALFSEVEFATSWRFGVTDSDGAFAFPARRGHYQLPLQGSRVGADLGYYGGESGFTNDPSLAALVNNLMSSVTGIVIPYGVVAGTVVGSDGQPAPNVVIQAFPEGGADGLQSLRTNFDGRFAMPVESGTYRLQVSCPRGGGGWYGDAFGFTPTEARATHVTVEDEDVTGLVITLPVLGGTEVLSDRCPEPVPLVGE